MDVSRKTRSDAADPGALKRKKGGKKGAKKKAPNQLEWTQTPFGVVAPRKDGSAFTITITVHEGEISHYTVTHISADGDTRVLGRAKSLDAAQAIAQKHADGLRSD